jgi:hypothetical protein
VQADWYTYEATAIVYTKLGSEYYGKAADAEQDWATHPARGAPIIGRILDGAPMVFKLNKGLTHFVTLCLARHQVTYDDPLGYDIPWELRSALQAVLPLRWTWELNLGQIGGEPMQQDKVEFFPQELQLSAGVHSDGGAFQCGIHACQRHLWFLQWLAEGTSNTAFPQFQKIKMKEVGMLTGRGKFRGRGTQDFIRQRRVDFLAELEKIVEDFRRREDAAATAAAAATAGADAPSPPAPDPPPPPPGVSRSDWSDDGDDDDDDFTTKSDDESGADPVADPVAHPVADPVAHPKPAPPQNDPNWKFPIIYLA